jgi:hypothetical protein
MRGSGLNLDFAQIGTVFNDATGKLLGGISDQNKGAVLKDLQVVQSSLEGLLTKHPGLFQGEAAIHAQNVVDQINLETQAINSVGTDPYAAKYINDVQRDLIDIVQGDSALAAMAQQHGASGFAPVPDLLVKPAQFQGNAGQTAFMKQFATDAVTLGQRAADLAAHGAAPDSADVKQLVSDINSFDTNANRFTVAQGGLYSARFNNEFASDGVNGTASRALIHGLQTGNAGEINAASNVLAANAADVAGNMLGIGDTPPPRTSGIPAHFDNLGQAGTVFNDATTKLIGGAYDGVSNDGNRNSIVADLTATRDGLKQLMSDHPDQFQGATAQHAQKIVGLLGIEIAAVGQTNSGPNAASAINAVHQKILNIVQNDANLHAAATAGGATGFMALPAAQPARVANHGFPGGGNEHGPAGGQHGSQHDASYHLDWHHPANFEHVWG